MNLKQGNKKLCFEAFEEDQVVEHFSKSVFITELLNTDWLIYWNLKHGIEISLVLIFLFGDYQKVLNAVVVKLQNITGLYNLWVVQFPWRQWDYC